MTRTKRTGIRRFNGKIYHEYAFETSKATASKIKNELKATGMLVRVEQVINGYVVYSRS